VAIAAEASAVWEKIGDFGDMSWHPAIFSTKNPGGNQAGAVRVLTLGGSGGPTVTEELTEHSDRGMRFGYRILEVDPKVLPVVGYAAEVVVEPGPGGCVMRWVGRFDPPPGVSAAEAETAMAGVYQGGLDAVKKAFD
jgi:hypothetical protein